jgi:hypothetical protein
MLAKYGDFTSEQLAEYRSKLHGKLFWLLLYKDPNTKDEFGYVDFDTYFLTLMKELNGLGDLLLHPDGLVEMLTVLEAAYKESKETDFNYKIYRKFVLDAHTILDRMQWEVAE